MELNKLPELNSKTTFSKPIESLNRNLQCRSPIGIISAKDRRRLVFTPTYKRVSWNKYAYQDKVHLPHQSENSTELEIRLRKKVKVAMPFTDNIYKKFESTKEKNPLKHNPARYLDSHSIEKNALPQSESKFSLPTINTDLELIKTINHDSISQLLTQNKLINNWKINCRSEVTDFTKVKRVRFQIIQM
ncbi:hypothetical protein SteCoe_15066 [Stentor coeruleus]|uniref:Uncharacterized protein n=1 Tax=Stentor coeruleus TaxID=5963 RepID=A0A1R2C4K3_9CILI|nr:hypothetical protein SteCoe_15066 [Stentor coeruleus]